MANSIKEKIFDVNDNEVVDGSIIDIHQTVNGQSTFIILSTCPLDIRYAYDPMRKYEYDKEDLLARSPFDGLVEFEIVGNLFESEILKQFKS